LLGLLGVETFGLFAQPVQTSRVVGPVDENKLPSALRRYLRATGDRLLKPGKERIQSTGGIETTPGTSSSFTWIREYPGSVRINGMGKNLIFDNISFNVTQLDDMDEDLLEGLSSDTEDAFFEQLSKGNRGRLLGAGAAVQGATGFGSMVDIFEMAMPVLTRQVKDVSVKHFMFDSSTGYLHRVAYSKFKNGVRSSMVTELRDYTMSNGVAVPTKIYRGANRQRRYQIQVNQTLIGVKANDNTFTIAR